MLREPCIILLEAGAGASVYGLFADARKLAGQTGHGITVVGNDVRVVVTPSMDEEQCRRAYTRALQERDREKQTRKPKPERRAEETYESIWDELTEATKHLVHMGLWLGRWHAQHRDHDLRGLAHDAEGLELIACRIKRLAEEQENA